MIDLTGLTWIKVARFWSKVEVGAKEACWRWRGKGRTNDGYGGMRVSGVIHVAHRIAFTVANGPIPDGLIVRHRCDNPECCNPFHLELGTHADNTLDKMARGRQWRPPRGSGHYNSKLTEEGARHILANRGRSNSALAKELGVSATLVSMVKNGHAWTHV